MLENSIYSVISPEGCASILWRDPSKSLEAAEAMKLTAKDLLNLGIIDEIIKEPLGGAHRDAENIAQEIKNSLVKNLRLFDNLSREEIYEERKSKFLKIGRDKGFIKSSNLGDKGLGYTEPLGLQIKRNLEKNKVIYFGLTILLLSI